MADIGSRNVISSRWYDHLPRAVYAHLERVDVSSNWFQVFRLDHDVFAIYEPHQWQEVISYLILGRKKALLFDTGNGIDRISDVVSELTSLPVVLLNSHTHFDHMGGNAEFDNILAMDTDFTRKNMAGYANELVGEEVSADALCAPLPVGIDPAAHHIPPFTASKYISDGHKIDLGGRVLEVLGTPGHAPDAIALLDSELGLLWTGDNYYEGAIWLFFPETDLNAFSRSVESICDLVPHLKMLHPSHNSPVARPESLYSLKESLSAVQKGSVSGKALSGGRIKYGFKRFSLIMR